MSPPTGLLPHTVSVFYRPEAVLLGADAAGAPGSACFEAVIDRVLPTTPVARVTLGGRPDITVLLLPRDLGRLDIRAGATVDAEFPSDSLCVFRLTGA